MVRYIAAAILLFSLGACVTPLELAKEEGWKQLTDEEAIALHSAGLVLEGPGWTATWTEDGRKIVNSQQGVKETRWEVRDGKFCQQLYRSDQWDCGNLSKIAIKDDKYRSFNASGSLRDEGTIIEGGL